MRRLGRGFTLIELVMVIVLLAIVATISVRFVTLSTLGALDTSARQQRALSAAIVSEQISRELRDALPTSVRASSDGRCLEWLPIVAASSYLDLTIGAVIDEFTAVALPGGRSASGRVVVYPYAGNLYAPGASGPVSPPATLPAGTDTVTVTLSSPHQFTSGSPQQRFFVMGSPVTLCQVAGKLFRYRDYGIQSTIATSLPASAPGREVLATRLVPDSVSFTVTPASLQRAGVVSFAFTLQDPRSGETTAVSQEVQIRNVP
ncbi:MAG: type II secretion system GspH family protein [Marinobacter sp.]|nr:type II secretion system GspH family protein [Marinobacter sp.]